MLLSMSWFVPASLGLDCGHRQVCLLIDVGYKTLTTWNLGSNNSPWQHLTTRNAIICSATRGCCVKHLRIEDYLD